MCLRILENFENNKDKIGYKIFINDEEDFYKSLYRYSYFLMNEEYEDYNNEILTAKYPFESEEEPYTTGYHIFDTIEELLKYNGFYSIEDFYTSSFAKYNKCVIVKVKYDDIVAKGLDLNNTKVIVARKMELIEEIKN